MKQNIYRWIGWASAVVLSVFLYAFCGTEPLPELDDKAGDALIISTAMLDIQGHTLNTRALGDDDLKDDKYNENKVNRLDVFIFKSSDESFVKAYHIETTGQEVSHGGVTGHILSNNWMDDGLVKNVAYKVYVVANSTNTTITSATSGVTLAELQALTVTDGNIYKRFKDGAASDDATYTSSKAFLMNAQVNWTITESGTQLVSGAKITLSRAAVKFVMDVSLSTDFADSLRKRGEQYGAPSWKYVNFNTVSAEVPGGTAPEAALVTGGSSAYLVVEQGTGDLAGHYTVVTYAYPQAWTSASMPDAAPAIFLSFPSRPIGSPTATPAYHYYYIPLCSFSTTSTVSNNLYKVNAVINSFGSSEVITSDPVNLNYEVMPWGASYAADIEATATDYLLATPTKYVFKGGTAGEFLSTKIKYYASGEVIIKPNSIKATYTDKNGQEQTVAATQYSIGTPANGEILIQSKVPTNGTLQQVEFTVQCGTKEQVVKFRHYPLDFITAEDGAYSTYNYAGWVTPGKNSTYSGSSVNENGQFYFYTSGSIFDAHVLYNNYVYALNADGSRGQNPVNTGTTAPILTNNQMYILQITSANDSHAVGKPTLIDHTENVYRRQGNGNYTSLGTIHYYTSDDNVISPAFMLGSQLGAVSPVSDSKYAAMHCALYLEHSSGKDWTGWRLPTKQELQFMIDNQNQYPDAMIEVLSGAYYWTLDGGYGYYSEGSGGSATGSKYVRCVRDVKPEELALINKFE